MIILDFQTQKRFQQMQTHEQEMMQKYGWYAHAVFSEDGIHANHHTHGLPQSLGHLDLQVALNIDPKISHGIFHTVVENIRNGKRYQNNKVYSDVIENFSVLMKEYEECGRKVLRILLPDPKGNLPTHEDCDLVYKSQLDDIETDKKKPDA